MNYKVIDQESCYKKRLMMPITARLNHAVADGYLIANVFRLLEKEIAAFCND